MTHDDNFKGAAQPGSNNRTENELNNSTTTAHSETNISREIARPCVLAQVYTSYLPSRGEHSQAPSWHPCPHRARPGVMEIGGASS
jgi:hypothetical protein